jgi:hypothetical protein
MKKSDKSGQFYLIAAMIVAAIIIGFALLNNSSSNNVPTDLEEMADELSIEGERVLDYDIVHSDNRFEEFARNYSSYAGKDKDIYFIIGDDTSGFHAYTYDEGVKVPMDSDLTVNGEITFKLNGIFYKFKKETGTNFYFLLTKINEDENYVILG